MVDNGTFENFVGWTNNSATIDTTVFRTNASSAKFTGGQNIVQTRQIAVTPGDKFAVNLWYQTTADKAGPGGLRIMSDAGGEAVDYDLTSDVAVSAGTWTQMTRIATVKAGVRTIRPRLAFALTAGTVWVDDFSIRRMNGGELIVDGAVTATKILAGSIGTNHITANTLNGDRITANTLNASAIIANSITGDRIQANTVNADRFIANTITGNKIASNTIIARNLLIGDFQNLATINEMHGLTVTSYGQTQVVGGYNTLVADSGSFFMVKDQDGPVPFKNGDVLYYSLTAKATAATTANFGVYIYNAAGSNKNTQTAALNIGTADTTLTGTITVPATDVTFGPAKTWVAGLVNVGNKGIQIKDVVLRRMNGGELIVDGAITTTKMTANTINADRLLANTITATKILAGEIGTNHMTANTINADRLTVNTITGNLIQANAIVASHILAGSIGTGHMTANTIDADRIVSNTITASKIQANAITASHINVNALDGQVITGATIQTSATNPRIVLDATKFEGYDANGNRYIKMDSTGLEQTGVFNTLLADKATSFQIGVPEAVLTGNGPTGTVGGVPGFAFIQGTRAYADSPRLFSYSNGLSLDLRGGGTDYNEGILQVSSGGVYAISGDGSFELGAARAFLKYNDSNYMSFTSSSGFSLNATKVNVNNKRLPIGLLSLQRLTGVTTVTTTDTQLSSVTVSVTPGMVLEVSGSYAGGPSGASNQYLSWGWRANGVRFAENSHRSNTNGYGEGDTFSGFYTVPAGQTSVTISLWGVVAAGGGTYVCPADSTSPKLQYAIKDIGDA
jgi:hypothetical protein